MDSSGLDSALAMDVVPAFCAAAGDLQCTTLAGHHQPPVETPMEVGDGAVRAASAGRKEMREVALGTPGAAVGKSQA